MSFSQARSYISEPFLTEFMVFFRLAMDSASSTAESQVPNPEDGSDVASDYYCSRISRLYNGNSGSLMEGNTAFFSMTQPLANSMEP